MCEGNFGVLIENVGKTGRLQGTASLNGLQMSIEDYREHLYQNILQKRKENRRAERERLAGSELLLISYYSCHG